MVLLERAPDVISLDARSGCRPNAAHSAAHRASSAGDGSPRFLPRFSQCLYRPTRRFSIAPRVSSPSQTAPLPGRERDARLIVEIELRREDGPREPQSVAAVPHEGHHLERLVGVRQLGGRLVSRERVAAAQELGLDLAAEEIAARLRRGLRGPPGRRRSDREVTQREERSRHAQARIPRMAHDAFSHRAHGLATSCLEDDQIATQDVTCTQRVMAGSFESTLRANGKRRAR
jgi:hypothetical protein